MYRNVIALVVGIFAVACGSTPGARPHDMSAAQHEREAQTEDAVADTHAAQYDPDATATRERCRSRGALGPDGDSLTDICWTSVMNPTASHQRAAEEHRRHGADHRAASTALRDAEARACPGIELENRDTSPFDHTEDISGVEQLGERGASITFRAVPGMTTEWLQTAVDCHLARNASLGHVIPEMPNCPLVPNGARASVRPTGDGFVVEVEADDAATAQEILSRAQRLRTPPAAAPKP